MSRISRSLWKGVWDFIVYAQNALRLITSPLYNTTMIPQVTAVDNLKYDGDGKLIEEYRPVTMTSEELLKIYPDALPIIERNLRIYKKSLKEAEPLYSELLSELLEEIYSIPDDNFKDEKIYTRDRGVAWITRNFYQHPVADLERNIKRLTRLQSLYKYKGEVGNSITAADIEKAKQFPIGDIIEINHTGFITCPFHSERHPSCKVYADNKFRCFGCGKNGDVVDIVRKIKGVEFLDAVRFLLKR